MNHPNKPRLVLDTNVCLDLFFFHDPRCRILGEALKSRTIEAVTNEACRKEWLRVLDYPALALDAVAKQKAIDAFDDLIACLTTETSSTPLPLCRDKDDQKFLELARDANAKCLVTKDKALLKLGGKTARAGLFEIKRPEAWAG